MNASVRITWVAGSLTLALVLAACPGEKTVDAPKVDRTPPRTAEGVEAAKAATTAATPPSSSGTDEGKRLYLTGCANCHGLDGSGSMMRQMLPNIGDLTSPETHKKLSDADIAERIAKGKDKMPPFESVFKPDQIKAIVAYVRTLKKG
jgi:mono/diheme cytochrome c family protein